MTLRTNILLKTICCTAFRQHSSFRTVRSWNFSSSLPTFFCSDLLCPLGLLITCYQSSNLKHQDHSGFIHRLCILLFVHVCFNVVLCLNFRTKKKKNKQSQADLIPLLSGTFIKTKNSASQTAKI